MPVNEEQVSELDLQKIESEDFSCPNCGAPIQYDPAHATLTCDYCGHKVILTNEASNAENDLLAAAVTNDSWKDETKVVLCENCGARNVISSREISDTCPFCGSHQVVESQELSGIKPHRVLPFKVTMETSRKIYSQWVRKKWFAPSKLKKHIPSLQLSGIYLPMWTYDANSFSRYSGRLGKYYTVTVGSGKNSHTETRVRWFNVSGVRQLSFDDILVTAGCKISQQDINKLAPFSTNDAFVYNAGYLAGFSAEHYTLDVRKGWGEAKKLVNPIIKRAILEKYSYDVVGELNISTNYDQIKYKYVLVPIWIGIYDYDKKHYRFLLNGETAKMIGTAPVSPWKVSGLVGGILLAVIIIIVLFSLFSSNEFGAISIFDILL